MAPFAEIVMDEPLQIIPPVTVTVGIGLTITEAVAVFEQLFTSVPVTVYVIVELPVL